jgi:hypothetical protein
VENRFFRLNHAVFRLSWSHKIKLRAHKIKLWSHKIKLWSHKIKLWSHKIKLAGILLSTERTQDLSGVRSSINDGYGGA